MKIPHQVTTSKKCDNWCIIIIILALKKLMYLGIEIVDLLLLLFFLNLPTH